MIIRSRVVVPMIGEPIENGAVAISGNKIAGVGRFDDVRGGHGGDVLDLGEQILLPGLINAHCHLDYTMLRGKIRPQQTFTAWVRAINALKATLTENDYVTAIAEGLAEAQSFGTTSMVNLEAFPELLSRVQTPSLRTWWCAEMIDVRGPVATQEILDNLRGWVRSRPKTLGGIGLAPHSLYTASTKLFAESTALARTHNLLLTTHLAESREEMQMFRDASGPLFEFLRSIGRPMDDCGEATPVSRLVSRQKLDERSIVAHLNEITESDFALLARGSRFHIAHCPSSHAFFGHTLFALQKLQKLGFNICLGTDSLASNSSLSLFSEMRGVLREHPSVSPDEVVAMATVNGANAIRQGGSLGRISPGFHADLIAIPSGQSGKKAYEAIVAFGGRVAWMMIDGRILWGE